MPISRSVSTSPVFIIAAPAALVIDPTRRVSTKTVAAPSIVTFSPTVREGEMFSLHLVNSSGAAVAITMPESFDVGTQALRTSFGLASNGREFLTWIKVGGVMTLMGCPAAPAPLAAVTLSSATINAAGTSLTLVFSESVTVGAGGNGGFVLNPTGADVTVAYASGSGSTTLVYTISRPILRAAEETAVLNYTQPGNGIEGTVGGGDVASFTNAAVTNNSTQVGGASYLINQNFETVTTGYDNGEAWTSAGTVDPANTTTPLVGAQSALISASGSLVSPSFAGQTDVWSYAQFKPSDYWSGVGFFSPVFSLRTAGDVELASFLVKYGAGELGEVRLLADGTESASSATLLARGTKYHCWMKYLQSGTCILAISASSTRPSVDGSGNVYITKAGGIGSATKVLALNVVNAPMRVDRILVSASEIGNAP